MRGSVGSFSDKTGHSKDSSWAHVPKYESAIKLTHLDVENT